uniref:Nucleoside diphosphate kinase 2 n=1 Tax=Arundo donax TaxID=35708 RepID=A0A0A9H613_ARUDO
MRRGTARRAPAAPALSLTPSRPRGLVEAAPNDRHADGRTAPEGRRLAPASGSAVLASTAMVSITPPPHCSVRTKTRLLD